MARILSSLFMIGLGLFAFYVGLNGGNDIHIGFGTLAIGQGLIIAHLAKSSES